MIRAANKWDIPSIVEMLRHYRSQTPLACLAQADNEPYIQSLLAQLLLGRGLVLVAEKNDEVIGMLLAIQMPSIWDPEIKSMTELAYWVEPEHRGTTAGYRLIEKYKKHCDQLKAQGKIDYYTISKMSNSPDLDYGRFSFEKIEETWRI